MAKDYSIAPRLTTTDNPWNPFTNFNEWYVEDLRLGHDCNGYLARVARTSDDLSDIDNYLEIDRAIDEIIELDPEQIYKKVYPNEN